MPVPKNELENMLNSHFPEAAIEVIDLAGDNDHYEVRIKSERFQGMNMVKQHRLVYQALGECVGSSLHALSLKTSVK